MTIKPRLREPKLLWFPLVTTPEQRLNYVVTIQYWISQGYGWVRGESVIEIGEHDLLVRLWWGE